MLYAIAENPKSSQALRPETTAEIATTYLFNCRPPIKYSEIPFEEQLEMGLSDGIIRFSIGLDNDIERTYRAMRRCMRQVGVL